MLEENNINISDEQSDTTENNIQEEREQLPVYYEQPSQFENPYQQILEKHLKRKEIRKIALAIGLSMLSLTVISFLFTFAYLFFSWVVVKFSLAQTIAILDNPAMQQVLQIVISSFAFLVPFTLAAKCLGLRIDHTIKFEKPKKGTFLPFVLIGIGFCAFSNIAMSLASSVFEWLGVDYAVDFGDSPKGIFGFLLSLIATAIVPALVEEFACRGILLGLLKKHGTTFAIVASSIAFGIMHGNFEQIPFATLVGLILGYIYVKTESIWCCVTVHFVNNSISVILTYLGDFVSANITNLIYVVYLILAMLAALIGVMLVSKRDEQQFEIEDQKDENITLKQKYIWFFTSPAIVLFIIVNVLQSLTFFFI